MMKTCLVKQGGNEDDGEEGVKVTYVDMLRFLIVIRISRKQTKYIISPKWSISEAQKNINSFWM